MTTHSKLQTAFTLHRNGQLAAAEVAYKDVLNGEPDNPNALMMLGIIMSDKPDAAQAEEMFNRLLAVQPHHAMALHNLGRLRQNAGEDRAAIDLFQKASSAKPDFAPIFNDWAVSLSRLGQRDQALALLDHALVLDPDYTIAHDNRGLVLFDLRRFDESAQAHFTALSKVAVSDTDTRILILLHLATAAAEAHELSAAERACRAVLELDAQHGEAIDQLAKILDRLLQDDEALALRNQLARSKGLMRNGNPKAPEGRILILGGVGAGHVPTRYLFDPDHFETVTFTMLSPDQPDAPLGDVDFAQLAACDLIFNSLGEVEKDGGQIPALKALCARLQKPLLNPPERVARTGRDHVQSLFGDIPGLVVPQVRWADRSQVADLTGQPPILVRPGGAHGGKDLALIDSPKASEDYLESVPYDRFLLTEFYDFKGARECYRKYRFIFVDRVPYAYHLAIGESWLVHYWRAEMGRSEWKKAEEERFLTDWPSVFGPVGSQAVRQVARNLDLDYGGMDCSILPDGRVLLFEANACMLLHLDDSQAEFPYKHQTVPLIRDAITRMVRGRR